MGYRARPTHGLRRRLSGGLLIAALIAALLAFVPGAPTASAGEVSKQGTLGDGYFFVATDGGIFNFGDSDFFGSTGDIALNKPIVGAASTPTGEGYWLVASDGGIFTFGDAAFLGSQGGGPLNSPIVAMAATPTGKGYWLFAADGGVFTHGDAEFFGSQGATRLNRPIVGADATPTGKGYYLVASDGGIFAHGDAEFFGSQGATRLNQPIVGMAATDDGKGYYLVASDGGIFSHGKTPQDAPFLGSQGGSPLNKPIVGMSLSASNQGYFLVASDGGIFTHGDANFLGSTGNLTLNKPVVAMAVTPNSPIAAPDFVARLSGQKEVAGGDADASGFANVDISDDEVCYNIKVNNLDKPASAAHIHKAPSGVNGPIVVTLKTPDANGTASACQDLDKTLAAAIAANPQEYYVNIHNADFTGGAARGQLKGHTGVALAAPDAGSTLAKIVVLDTENPNSATVARTFETSGAAIAGADFKPGTTDAYILLISKADGSELTLVKSTISGETTVIASAIPVTPGSAYGVDFNPTVGLIRVINNAGANFRLDPATGAKVGGANDTNLSYAAGDSGAGAGTQVNGAAYTNNFVGATTTTLFDIDYFRNTLVRQGGVDGEPSPNGGVLTTIGPLGFDVSTNGGFDIAKAPAGDLGTTLFVGQPGASAPDASAGSVVLAIDRSTGKAINIGSVGSDGSIKVLAFSVLA